MSVSLTPSPPQGPEEDQPPTDTIGASFTPFPRLPPEIRAMIWELCLPKRVVPFSIIALCHQDYHSPDRRDADNNNTINGVRCIRVETIMDLLNKHLERSCRIALVSREAREAALSLRRRAEDLGLPWLGKDATFDPRTDTVLLDCDVFVRYRDMWDEVRTKLSAGAGAWGGNGRGVSFGLTAALFRWCGAPYRIQETEVDEEVVLAQDLDDDDDGDDDDDFENDDDVTISESDMDDAGFRVRQRAWPIVMRTVLLEVKSVEACGTGLFGLFGEEPSIFIDLRNKRQVELLKRIPRLTSVLFPVQRTVKESRAKWKRYKSGSRPVSRMLGLVGCKEEGGSSMGSGPYPVINVERQWRLCRG
ncbi:hypothetical protein N658DRAFT_552398 [Parathielavia hyrcaniae]|uniref:2EXR domain-containing protein n=1 Tax=Parathielavia hyrcaniae TaxID=113614 RepID=A0AAN6T275_9PEZI|nr:hypothetical protein N658DRAFT_552398 [Parathielavia hyrcaniae]